MIFVNDNFHWIFPTDLDNTSRMLTTDNCIILTIYKQDISIDLLENRFQVNTKGIDFLVMFKMLFKWVN